MKAAARSKKQRKRIRVGKTPFNAYTGPISRSKLPLVHPPLSEEAQASIEAAVAEYTGPVTQLPAAKPPRRGQMIGYRGAGWRAAQVKARQGF